MEEETSGRRLSSSLMIIITLVAVFLGLQLVGPIIGFLISIPFYEGTIFQMTEALANPTEHPEMKLPLFFMQGLGTFLGLIIIPMLLLRRQGQSIVTMVRQPIYLQVVVLVMAIVVSFIVADSIFIEWNQNLNLPESMAGVEQWMKSTEEGLAKLTEYMTSFESTGQFITALLVIAVLPAIGEEIVFRGIIQQELFRSSKNIHLSIWLSAFIFSAFHLQFYGLVPRMLLGALFGYLYYWSGNLTMAMLAHFVNNGFAVIGMYLYQQGKIDIDMETTEAAPWPAVLSGFVVTALLLFLYKRFFDNRPAGHSSTNDPNHLSARID